MFSYHLQALVDHSSMLRAALARQLLEVRPFGAKLFHDELDRNLGGLFGDKQELGNLTISEACGDPAPMSGDLRRDFGRNLLMPPVYLPDCRGQFTGRHVLPGDNLRPLLGAREFPSGWQSSHRCRSDRDA
jgi:hypothetical protein